MVGQTGGPPQATAESPGTASSETFLDFMRKGWHDDPLSITPRPERANYAKRRFWLSRTFAGETLIIPSGNEKVRANDTSFAFRPGSDFVYLTGDHDPDSVLMMRPTGSGHDAVLYTHQRNSKASDLSLHSRNGELPAGSTHTLAEKAEELCLETAPLEDLGKALADTDTARTRVLRGLDPAVDRAIPVHEPDRRYEPDRRKTRDHELASFISELKLLKDEWEIVQLQAAVDATVRGFEDIARVLPADRPVRERLLEGIFGLRARHDGNGVGFGSMVASGAHAAILNWTRNTGQTHPGDLLLMDMGVEGNNFYTADVTRTIPISGTFTPLQRQVYDIVHASQQAGMDAITPGVRFQNLNRICMRVLAEGLHDLGVLPVSVDEAMDERSTTYRRWTLQSFGHMLGIDMHDCANARTENYQNGALSEGYVLTVEPGLYFQPGDELVPEELRGIGVRIEDDVLVTSDGYRNLSADLPRTSDQVENWLAAQREQGPRLPG